MPSFGLIETALEDAGTALAVFARPEQGQAAIIEYANAPFCTALRRTREALVGAPIGHALEAVADPVAATTFLHALQTGAPAQLDLHFTARRPELWFGCRLTFPDPGHAVLAGRDITASRRAAEQDAQFRRLMAGIFLRVDAAVALVTTAGRVSMANPAFHNLVGFDTAELPALQFDDLVAPPNRDRVRDAWTRPRAGRTELACAVRVKAGDLLPVRLTTELLPDGPQDLHVVTLEPLSAHAAAAGRAGHTAVGQLRAISLGAIRQFHGPLADTIAARAMLAAERVVRRRLQPDDVVGRVGADSFAMWFHCTDNVANGTALARILRDVRLALLTEFGTEMAQHVQATLVTAIPPEPPAARHVVQEPARILYPARR